MSKKLSLPLTYPLIIKKIEHAHADELTHLRQRAYAHQYGSNVDLKALRWNPNLSHTYNLGLWNQDELVSAYRIDFLVHPQQLEFFLQTPESAQWPLPVFLGCRAATEPTFQNKKLHFMLRVAAIRLMIQTNVKYLLSTFESTNPWKRTLELAGYNIHPSNGVWSDFLKNSSTPSIAALNLEAHGHSAASTFESVITSTHKKSICEIFDSKIEDCDFQNWFRVNVSTI